MRVTRLTAALVAVVLMMPMSQSSASSSGRSDVDAGPWVRSSEDVGASLQSQALYDATAVSSSAAWAVGQSFGPSSSSSLILHWNGVAWSVDNAPSPSGFDVLNAVSAASPTDVWAVGQSGDPGAPEPRRQALIEHWDGASWSVIPSPTTSVDEALVDVDVISATDAWAVGWSYDDSGAYPLVLHWTGASWSVVSIQPGTYMRPEAVAAVSDSDVWVLGSYIPPNNNGNMAAFAQHWDGSSWTFVEVPDASRTGFHDMSAVAANDIWATGWGDNGRGPLTEHWDGSSWSIVACRQSKGYPDLVGVSAVSATDAWTVGQPTDGSMAVTVEHWAGASWELENPDVPSAGGTFFGVAAVSTDDVWLVGQEGRGWGAQTLVQHWNGSSWKVVPTPNPIQDNSAFAAYDAWESDYARSALGDGYRSSAGAGSSASFRFTGTKVSWATRMGPDQGIASVSIDGHHVADVDLYSPSVDAPVTKNYGGLPAGDHRLVIRVTGHHDPRSSGAAVAIDALGTPTVWHQELSSSIAYDGWEGLTSPDASGGSLREVGARGAVTAKFQGRSLVWVTRECPSCGRAQVIIDGELKGTVDLYSATVRWAVQHRYRRLGPGVHVVRIVATDTKRPASDGTDVAVDAFIAL